MGWKHRLGELKDVIAYVMAYAPDRFPHRDYLGPEEQVDLHSIFNQVREGFEDIAISRGESVVVQQCRHGIEDAYQSYRSGDRKAGFLAIQDVLHKLSDIK